MQHPPVESLLAHASGELDPLMRVILEAHLDLCPACRGELATLVEPGGWLLRSTAAPAGGAPADLWQRLEARINDADTDAVADAVPQFVPLPLAARRELPPGGRVHWWRPLLRGARIALLGADPATGARLAVAHMPGGKRFPRHEHLGFEHAVVLSGGYEDERGEFLAGDYAVYAPGSEHGPQTLDGDDCWILFRLGGPVRFHGWRGALQRPFL